MIIRLWVETDEETHVTPLGLEEGFTGLLADGHMAAIATHVRNRMTDLASQFVAMQNMLSHRVAGFANRFVTGFAGRALHTRIAVRHLKSGLTGIMALCANCLRVVHFRSTMTRDTIHASLTEVHIARNVFVFTKILVAYAAAMTSSAVTAHRGGFLDDMPGNEATSHRTRLADVTIATGGMARGTVIAKHLFKRRLIFGRTACIEAVPIPCQRNVQAFLEMLALVTMTGCASLTLAAWVGNQTGVGSFHIWRLLTAVTIGASHLAVRCG